MTFEHGDRTRDKRVRYAQLVCCAPEALLFGDADEYTHCLNLVHSLCILSARLIDYGCVFALRKSENRCSTLFRLHVEKNGFRLRHRLFITSAIFVNLRKGAGCIKSASRVSKKRPVRQSSVRDALAFS
ncbi:hypothetical protein [Burkholderia ubonensis]|uniref:hypothetical protein n=1 Tax=Burkholderia ubonensis TaxID=101571 RepID=UPI001E58E5B7|nr:hypothetical protein [Burkholderia ubonensis]